MTNQVTEDALQAAIAQLYETFEIYPLKPVVVGCTHCVTEVDHQDIHSKPLHELTADDLDLFIWKTMTTWGDADDFRHFLPRIMELLTSGSKAWFDLDLLLGKLEHGEWRSWPQNEQETIKQFLRSFWPWALASDDWQSDLIDSQAYVFRLILDIDSFLDIWQHTESTPTMPQFVELVRANSSLTP